MRDFVAEIRALIEQEFHDGDIAPVVATKLVEKLKSSDPELLEGWLYLNAVRMITEMIGQIDRSDRAHARAVGPRSAFADAAESGDVSGFLEARFVVDDANTRLSLGRMHREHLIFVAQQYGKTARAAQFEAAFFRALALKVGSGTVADHFTDDQLTRLRSKINV